MNSLRGETTKGHLAGRALRRPPGAVLTLLLCGVVAGCGSITAETGRSTFIPPGKFNVYTCSDLDHRLLEVQKRKNELEQLMARAGEGAGGAFVNTIAYRAEYQSSRDELIELSKAAADKQCASKSQWSSGRAIF